MARGRRGAKHGEQAGKPEDPEPDTTASDAEQAAEAARKRAFTAEQALEIAATGAPLAARLNVLLRKQATLRKKLSDVGESIHTIQKDLAALWDDQKNGQQRLDFAAEKKKGEKPEPAKPAAPYAGPTRYTAKHGDRELVAARLEDGKWAASIGTDKIGVFDDPRAAMQFCCSSAKINPQLVGSVQWQEDSVDGKGTYARPVRTDELEPMSLEFHARVGAKTCRMKQDSPGKWWARVGDVPIAMGLNFEKANRLAEAELLKGAPDGTKIEWRREFVEDFLPEKKAAAKK